MPHPVTRAKNLYDKPQQSFATSLQHQFSALGYCAIMLSIMENSSGNQLISPVDDETASRNENVCAMGAG